MHHIHIHVNVHIHGHNIILEIHSRVQEFLGPHFLDTGIGLLLFFLLLLSEIIFFLLYLFVFFNDFSDLGKALNLVSIQAGIVSILV
jgi:hypothetical protein